ncbi:MAG TPA: RsmB/NOP family class I SAM-dependent RNA methyltransferase [Candidatus Bilamarchaeaceae archaeon]|nr:RsmB/NOP family class I SAM-dependent RNA methyltransferase [Candidatus Bilamarchaeaceae archaeon]
MERGEYSDWLNSYTDAEKCEAAFARRQTFFRVNTIKIPLEKFRQISKIPYAEVDEYPAAFRLTEVQYPIGKTWEYFLGYLHPQSLSSMLVSLALDPKPDEYVLDACAAPGSKFSHMAMLMGNQGVLAGNDQKGRLSALYATINRLNILNALVTVRDSKKLDWKGRFDKVLLDAPCSSLGSEEYAVERWNVAESRRMGAIQTKMLFAAYDALKPGGHLIYSTCTYAKEENEQVVQTLLENVPTAKLTDVGWNVPHDSGLSEYGNEFRRCCRIYPQHLQSEGFFIAKITKEE